MAHDGCPICRAEARVIPLDAYGSSSLVECIQCTTFTISGERLGAFGAAWQNGDREMLMCMEHLSRYLRLETDDADREITAESWMPMVIEGQNAEEDD